MISSGIGIKWKYLFMHWRISFDQFSLVPTRKKKQQMWYWSFVLSQKKNKWVESVTLVDYKSATDKKKLPYTEYSIRLRVARIVHVSPNYITFYMILYVCLCISEILKAMDWIRQAIFSICFAINFEMTFIIDPRWANNVNRKTGFESFELMRYIFHVIWQRKWINTKKMKITRRKIWTQQQKMKQTMKEVFCFIRNSKFVIHQQWILMLNIIYRSTKIEKTF